jgi:hypothetical protein
MNPWIDQSTGLYKPVTFRDAKHKLDFEEGCTIIFPDATNIYEEQPRFAAGNAMFIFEIFEGIK